MVHILILVSIYLYIYILIILYIYIYIKLFFGKYMLEENILFNTIRGIFKLAKTGEGKNI